MSVLTSSKAIDAQKVIQPITLLYEHHPLESRALDFRLQYLAALALLTALDREPTDDEVAAFTHLVTVLGVASSESLDLLNERNNASEEDIGALFAAVRDSQATWNYLADLAWLHSADSRLDEHETAAYPEAMHFLGIDPKSTEGAQAGKLPRFMLALRTGHEKDYVALRNKTTWPKPLKVVLSGMTRKVLDSYQPKRIANRYIDFGDGTIGDPQEKLMWKREKETAERHWKSTVEHGAEAPFAGYSDWRVPYKEELVTLLLQDQKPPFCKAAFPDGEKTFWSGTKYTDERAWYVDFVYGSVSRDAVWHSNHVRLVRDWSGE